METTLKNSILTDKATHKLVTGMVRKVLTAAGLRTDSAFIEDTAQDVMVSLLTKLDLYDASRASVNTFIGVIAKNAAVDAMRAYHGVVSLDNEDEDGNATMQPTESLWDRYETRRFHSPEATAIIHETSERINRYLSTLTERDRDVWATLSADDSADTAAAVAVRWGMGHVPAKLEEGRSEDWYRARSVRTLFSRIKANVEAVAAFE